MGGETRLKNVRYNCVRYVECVWPWQQYELSVTAREIRIKGADASGELLAAI